MSWILLRLFMTIKLDVFTLSQGFTMFTINNKDSIDTGAKQGSYSVKVHSEKCSKWYMK